MKIPFLLLSSADGSPMPGVAENVIVKVSVDGSTLTTLNVTAIEIANGYYYVNIDDSDVACDDFALIEITCPGAQKTVKQYTPEKELMVIMSSLLNWNVNNNILTLKDPDGNVVGRCQLTKDADGNIIQVEPYGN